MILEDKLKGAVPITPEFKTRKEMKIAFKEIEKNAEIANANYMINEGEG